MMNGIANMGRRIARWRRASRACGELYALDDRMLKDLGVQRSQITSIARGADRPYRGRR
jgi:uncharacterized protein YjiS (DUF1127 family)